MSVRPDFPKDGWSSSAEDLPHGLSVGVVLHHLEAKGKYLTPKKPFNRGFDFFFWSYIHGGECCSPASTSQKHFLKAKCWKKDSYCVECVVERCVTLYEMEVTYAHCTCTAGISGSCRHVVALLLTVNYCDMKGQDLPQAESVTTRQQQWGPKPRNVQAQPVMKVVVEKAAEHRKDGNMSAKLECSLYDARGPATKTGTDKHLQNLMEDMKTALPASPLMTALHGNTCIRNVPSLYGAVPFGSTLCHQLLPPDVYHVPQPVTSPIIMPHLQHLPPPLHQMDVPSKLQEELQSLRM